MVADFLFAFWFFIPAGCANTTPIVAAKTPVFKHWDTPVDFGKSWRGHRILGDHKTWRGITTGVIFGILIQWTQVVIYQNWAWLRQISPVNYNHVSILWLGFLLGFGALFGDLIKSFVKRRFSVGEGKRWFPFDQLDYIVGGLIFSSIYVQLSLEDYVWILSIYFSLHLLFSFLGYKLKLKEQVI